MNRIMYLIATGADSNHFANLRVLVGSWLSHMDSFPLLVCDFGLSQPQRDELARISHLEVLPPPRPISHPWEGKSLLGRFLGQRLNGAKAVMWIDADAFFNQPLPDLQPLIDGYDLLIDAHVQSVGEITDSDNLARLGLRADDAYFSAGWWVLRPGCLLDSYERLTALVRGRGNLWEADAFVAAIYSERLKVRTVCGSIWHVRGKTSLDTCTVHGSTAFHGAQPVNVIHANARYLVRPDGRRVFLRQELANLQTIYEDRYFAKIGTPIAAGTLGPHPIGTGRPLMDRLRRRVAKGLRRIKSKCFSR